ncbi:hypothetical protein Taro_001231 [Colocasia esculenta]|uniref:Uncharacterized protein n=1 Tax=Colocasia esculenta TaxID=4460 RepID=A0A843TK13_COLES|nr:hypothetical protein [Colocasia esculenta]
MSAALFSCCCFALRSDSHRRDAHVRRVAAGKCVAWSADEGSELNSEQLLRRRAAMVSGLALVSSVALGFPGEPALAVKQGLLAGRIPGLSEPDENGWRTYRRPDDKSGGHGVGWSPIIPYIFKVPGGWDEVPVSIADLGGTEIDLRFANSKEGRLFVLVAPVLRFSGHLCIYLVFRLATMDAICWKSRLDE